MLFTKYSWSTLKTAFMNMFTGVYDSTIRVKTDQEQRTFAECAQWNFLDELLYDSSDATALNGADYIPVATTIIYKMVLAKPLNLVGRKMHISAGGRKYLAYKSDGTETVTEGSDGFQDFSDKITSLNPNLPPELSSLPESGITFSRALDTTFVAGAEQHPVARDTQAVQSGGLLGEGTPSPYSDSGNKRGLEAGTYYLILSDYGSTTDATDGYLLLSFEGV